MGESVGSRETLGVSVSFGKYENDALSWEKWSTFSPNKYLEEVGKCSTPGSVAQKKAFFEAHYRKIAAMKAEAELLDQEKAAETSSSESDDHTEDSFEEIIKEEHKEDIQSKVFLNVEQVQNEIITVDESGKSQDEKPSNDNQSQCAEEATSVNDKSVRDESCKSKIALISNVDKLEEAVLINDESTKLVEHHFQMDSYTEESQESNQEIPKPTPQNMARKANPTKLEKNLVGMKKKPASIISKLPETSSTRLSKPKATPTSSLTKANASLSSSSSKNKNSSLPESRRITPTSLHLSMSMNSVNSDTVSSLTSSRRRSLFMEQMRDKGIVKRAFKTFQNKVNQLPSSERKSSGPKQLSTKESGKKTSTSMTYQKENERSRKAAEKITPFRGQLGPTWKSVSSGSLKGIGVDERSIKAAPTSVILRSNERAERRKEFFKNLEEKSNAREAERIQLRSKSKELKDAEMKKLKQNLSFKAKPMPSFYRTQAVSKTTSEKEAIKIGTARRPDSHR